MNYFEEQHRALLSSYISENNLEAIPDQTTEIAAAQLRGEARFRFLGWLQDFLFPFTKFQIPYSRGGVFVLLGSSRKAALAEPTKLYNAAKGDFLCSPLAAKKRPRASSTRQTTVKQQTATRAAKKILRDALNYI